MKTGAGEFNLEIDFISETITCQFKVFFVIQMENKDYLNNECYHVCFSYFNLIINKNYRKKSQFFIDQPGFV